MSKAAKAAGPDKGSAARAEKRKDERRTLDYRGVELVLPEKLAASVLPRWAVLDDNDAIGAMRLLKAIIGPANFAQVVDKMDTDGLMINVGTDPSEEDKEVLTEIGQLVGDALASYGVTPGESEASPSS